MSKERTYLSLDIDLKAILKTIQEKEGYSTLNDLIIDILEDYAINSNIKFKYQDNLTNTIREEMSTINNSVLDIYKLLHDIIKE